MSSSKFPGQPLARQAEPTKTQVDRTTLLATTGELNQIARRLKQYKTESEWCDSVLDGAAHFCSGAALFALEGESLRLKGARNLPLQSDATIELASAAAFRNARDSRDTVVTLRVRNEVSEVLAPAASASASTPGRALIIPVTNGQRVAAMLFAASEERTDANVLELIANIASAALERSSGAPAHVQISAPAVSVSEVAKPAAAKPSLMSKFRARSSSFVAAPAEPESLEELPEDEAPSEASPMVNRAAQGILSNTLKNTLKNAPKQVEPSANNRQEIPSLASLESSAPARPPEWPLLGESEKLLHVRALRFARVKVAEMLLYRPEACRAGKQQKNVYLFLSQEIEKARELFRKQFMTIPSMLDYFHLELLQQVAASDETLLGADYPGQMV